MMCDIDRLSIGLGAFVLVLLFIVLPGLLYIAAKQRAEFNEACTARGGTPVWSRDFHICVDPSVFK